MQKAAAERREARIMLADVAPNLHTFFVPQMQQLKLRETPVRCGAYSAVDEEWGHGWLWVMSIADDCLIAVHDLTLKETFTLKEYPTDFSCIASMSRATAACTPLRDHPTLLQDNIASFQQSGGEVAFDLKANERYTSRSITFTPRFFDRLTKAYPHDFDALAHSLATAPVNSLSPDVTRILHELDPRHANLPGAQLYYTSKVMEAVSIIMSSSAAHTLVQRDLRQEEAMHIVSEAKEVIHNRFNEQITLQQIADAIYVSRTHLCTVFKQETGMSVGEYLHKVRMQHGRELLASTTEPISAISRAIGYTRQSSFAEAFKAEAGITPSEWRREKRAQ